MADTSQTTPDAHVGDRSRQDRPDHPAALDDAAMRQARNSAAFWAATGRSRGHEVIHRRSFLAVLGGKRAGTRILLQEPDPDASELAELTELAARSTGPVDVEDPFSSTDLSHLGMRNWQMPIMVRPPGPVSAPAMEVIPVQRAQELQAAERIVIEGFELTRFAPYRPGEMFPATLPEQPGVDVFLAVHNGEAVGAGVTVVHDGFGSHYWVGTPSAHRSRGAGRAVMLGSLAPMANLPVTLTASRLGRPLYESLGFTAVTSSTWWSSQ
ncbi:GNAT family N-acetyltransferase [Streptomyces sp. BPTC-684]|uniref:GNAT family N-acetyltransferase n=1 Tax=Streptomyces sp. BPTC-684 TaxID=3043734 RepID=UPI0024B1E3FA|nr:GNAT family N-acetyltransferase [Streptomyces sp. BPTC-684]WHM40845.1 GNAT family N-acetyltransferase [Streptomyces sp. BPTC-684]